MSREPEIPKISQRQAQILDIIFRLNEASVADIMEHLPQSPTQGAVRRMLNILYAKGVVGFRHEGAKKIYTSKVDKEYARKKALNRVAEIFFKGSSAQMMASLFEDSSVKLSADERTSLYKLIEKAKRQEKNDVGSD